MITSENMEAVAGLVRAALWAARYRQAAKVDPTTAGGWEKMAQRHMGEVERLADELVGGRASGKPGPLVLVHHQQTRAR